MSSLDRQAELAASDRSASAEERLRLATQLSGISVWSYELAGPDLALAVVSDPQNTWERRSTEAAVPHDLASRIALTVLPEHQARVTEGLQACIDGSTDMFDAEYRVRQDDGTVTWRLGRGVVIRDPLGTPIRITGTSLDVTRLKQVEEQSKSAEEQLRMATQLSGVGTWSFELSGPKLSDSTQLHVNNIMEQLGYASDPALSIIAALMRVVVPEDQARVAAAVRDCIEGRTGQFDTEYRVRTSDGAIRWRLARSAVIRDELGHAVRYAGTSVDITRVKEAEEAARAANERLNEALLLGGFVVDELDLRGVDDPAAAFVQRPFFESVVRDEMVRVTDMIAVAIRDGVAQTELRAHTAPDDVRWRAVRCKCIRGANGEPQRLIAVSSDIQKIKTAEQEVRRVNERLELAVRGSKVGTWDVEILNGDFANAVAVTSNFYELLGYDGNPPDVADIADGFRRTLSDAARDALYADVYGFLVGSTERDFSREIRVVHRDGTDRWLLSRGAATRNAAGMATRLTGASIDITDLKVAERALKESEERLRRMFENAAVGMVLFDLHGRLVEYNARFCEFLGYAREELVGCTFDELTLPDEMADDGARLSAVIRGELPSFTRDRRCLCKDGAIVWGNVTVSVLQSHADGTPVHVMAIVQDITERKLLEVAIEKAQSRVQLAMRGSDIAVFEGEFPEGSVERSTWTYFNMWEPMGMDPSHVPTDFAASSRLIIHPDDYPAVVGRLTAAIESQTPSWYLEHRFIHADGSVRWRLSRATLLYDDAGRVTSFIGTEADITELKKTQDELQAAREAAEAASRAKDEFLANVSHEIRTPMNAILGMTELALDSSPSEHQRQLLSTVRSAAKNLLTIINDLLDFSKIAAGKLTLDRADFSLRAAVGDTVRALAVRAHRKGLELLCHVRPDVPDGLEGDAGRLRQVLMNLVGNAIKFTQRGEVEVEVGVESEPSGDGRVGLVFTVRDTGIGIALEKQRTIFDAFEQEDASTTRKYGGTGLGLTIAARLAKLMDGDVTVASTPGVGSRFRFTARFARSSPADAHVAPSERLSNLDVLVVDDHETNRRILVEWLISWRMRVTPAGSAGEALAAVSRAHARGAPFSLALLDARMPDQDGISLAEEIRARWPDRSPRLILLSSDDSAELSGQARRAGVLAYLVKPVEQSELLEAIWAVMKLAPEVPAPAGRAGRHRGSPRLRVLVAEDNDLNITLLTALLERRGHSVELARDGRRAVDVAAHGELDLVLLDLHLPVLDGFEVVRMVRSREVGTGRHVPIVALTARSSARDRELCLAAGMDELLPKPIEAAPLLAVIERLSATGRSVASPAMANQKLLDPRAILRACGSDEAVFDQMRVGLRRNVPALMQQVRTALQAADLSSVRVAAQQLVGTLGALSTTASDTAASLEDAAAVADRESCAVLVTMLGRSCDALLAAITELTFESLSL